MNKEVKPVKYRRLSITALVTGILAISFGVLYNFLWMQIANLLQSSVDVSIMPYIVLPGIGISFGLAITAVVCGSIDLKRIKAGIYTRKGKGFDITGIVLGGLFILLVLWFLLGELLMPH
jgi:hypothetical protein